METTEIKTILAVSSPSFTHEGFIPKKFTCEGSGANPALEIDGFPEETKTLALIVEDPDAVSGIFDHWVTWNIPPAHTITENAVPGVSGKNGKGSVGFTPPCPPKGT